MKARGRKQQPLYVAGRKRMVTLDQKVDAVTRIIMTGSPKAEVARNMNVAESTFRGWCKNKEIVARAHAKCHTMKCMAAAPGRPAPAVRRPDGDQQLFLYQQAQIVRYRLFCHYALSQERALAAAATTAEQPPSTVSSWAANAGSAAENSGTESRSSSSSSSSSGSGGSSFGAAAEEPVEEPLDLTTHSRNASALCARETRFV